MPHRRKGVSWREEFHLRSHPHPCGVYLQSFVAYIDTLPEVECGHLNTCVIENFICSSLPHCQLVVVTVGNPIDYTKANRSLAPPCRHKLIRQFGDQSVWRMASGGATTADANTFTKWYVGGR